MTRARCETLYVCILNRALSLASAPDERIVAAPSTTILAALSIQNSRITYIIYCVDVLAPCRRSPFGGTVRFNLPICPQSIYLVESPRFNACSPSSRLYACFYILTSISSGPRGSLCLYLVERPLRGVQDVGCDRFFGTRTGSQRISGLYPFRRELYLSLPKDGIIHETTAVCVFTGVLFCFVVVFQASIFAWAPLLFGM